MSAEPITGLEGVGQIPEEIPEGIETPDYTTRRLVLPGKYISMSRTATVTEKKQDDSKGGKRYLSVAFNLVGGIVDPISGRVFGTGQFPFRTWATSLLMSRRGQGGVEIPGKTSSLAEYLRFVGVDPKSFNALAGDTDALFAALKEAVANSQQTPVGVVLGWRNRTEKDPTGNYPKSTLYTKDFNAGTREAPHWVQTVIKDGVTYEASETIERFYKV